MTNHLVTVCFAVAVLLLASCKQPAKREAQFIESEYAPYAGKGTASISGQAFSVTRGGDVKLAAGRDIVLNPCTSYSKEWWEKAVMKEEPNQPFPALEPPDERARPFNRTTPVDAEGRFRFDELKPGRYYLACWHTWMYSSLYTGGWIGAQVELEEGENLSDVLLTSDFRRFGF